MSRSEKPSSELDAYRTDLVRQGMESLFEDQKFSGDLMSRLFRLGMSEEEMDTIFKRAEDDVIGFVTALTEAGAGMEAQDALTGFIFRLKRQILKNPSVYVEGS